MGVGVGENFPTCDFGKVRMRHKNYAVIQDAHQAKRDSGGVRGIPKAISVDGPMWHRALRKKVIRNPIGDVGFWANWRSKWGCLFIAEADPQTATGVAAKKTSGIASSQPHLEEIGRQNGQILPPGRADYRPGIKHGH